MTSKRIIAALPMAAVLLLPACLRSGYLRGGETSNEPTFVEQQRAGAEVPATPVDREAVAEYFSSRLGLTLQNVYWGEFHAHSDYSVDAAAMGLATGTPTKDPAGAYAYARDVAQLDFVGLSDHAEEPNPAALPVEHRRLSPWQSQLATAQQHNDEDDSDGAAFIVFAGWEYTNTHGCLELDMPCGSEVGYGHKNALFRSLEAAELPSARYGVPGPLTLPPLEAPTATDLWERLDDYRPSCSGCAGSALTGPHTPAMVDENSAGADHRTDWSTMDADFVRNVEILSKWGSSEGASPLTCALADTPVDYDSSRSLERLTVRQTLLNRWNRA